MIDTILNNFYIIYVDKPIIDAYIYINIVINLLLLIKIIIT